MKSTVEFSDLKGSIIYEEKLLLKEETKNKIKKINIF
jgi:hypothetical protein